MSDEPKKIRGLPPPGVEGAWNEEVRYDLCRRAWEMRVNGHSIPEIATALGVKSRRTVTTYLAWWREHGEDENGDNPVTSRRLMALARLDVLMSAYLPRALGVVSDDPERPGVPDPAAAVLVLKIMEREAKLVGYDAAIKIDAQGSERPLSPELVARLEATKALVRQKEAELTGRVIEGQAV